MIKLRPHHLFCLQFFEGKGYSDDFVSNTYSVLSRIESGEPITVVSGCDELCSHCPKKIDGVPGTAPAPGTAPVCEDDNECIDERVRGLGITSLPQAAAYVSEYGIGGICGDCMWFDICAKRVSDIRNNT